MVADGEKCFLGVIIAREGTEETSLSPIFLLPPVTSKSNEPNLQITMRFFLLTSLKAWPALQIKSQGPCIIINHHRFQGCWNWADVGKYVTDA